MLNPAEQKKTHSNKMASSPIQLTLQVRLGRHDAPALKEVLCYIARGMAQNGHDVAVFSDDFFVGRVDLLRPPKGQWIGVASTDWSKTG